MTLPDRRTAEVFDYIRAWIADHGYPPRFIDIMAACGIRGSGVLIRHMRALVKLGKITWERPGPGRTPRVIKLAGTPKPELVGLSSLGWVFAPEAERVIHRLNVVMRKRPGRLMFHPDPPSPADRRGKIIEEIELTGIGVDAEGRPLGVAGIVKKASDENRA